MVIRLGIGDKSIGICEVKKVGEETGNLALVITNKSGAERISDTGDMEDEDIVIVCMSMESAKILLQAAKELVELMKGGYQGQEESGEEEVKNANT